MSVQERQFNLPSENVAATLVFTEAVLGTDEFELSPFASEGYKTRVYACEAASGSYILRHGYDRAGLAKDRYIAEHFADTLPVPEVLDIKHLDDKSALCLSTRIAGSEADAEQLGRRGTPINDSFSQTLRALHNTDLSISRGWGLAKANGQGALPKRLFDIGIQHRLAARYWNFLVARNTNIDRSSFRDIVALQRSLGGFSIGVQERKLCHGDLKGNNLLVAGDSITGVIDWARFAYADPAYDLGILHVRYPGAIDSWAHAEAIGITEQHLRERVLYYAIGECTVGIGFFGQQDNEAKMVSAEKRLLAIADEVEG